MDEDDLLSFNQLNIVDSFDESNYCNYDDYEEYYNSLGLKEKEEIDKLVIELEKYIGFTFDRLPDWSKETYVFHLTEHYYYISSIIDILDDKLYKNNDYESKMPIFKDILEFLENKINIVIGIVDGGECNADNLDIFHPDGCNCNADDCNDDE